MVAAWPAKGMSAGAAAIAMLLAVFGLGSSGQAADLTCGAGDAACLIAAIRTANALTKPSTIRLATGIYTLTAVAQDAPRARHQSVPGAPGAGAPDRRSGRLVDYLAPPFIEDEFIDSPEFTARWQQLVS
jgi:hypothetical protein